MDTEAANQPPFAQHPARSQAPVAGNNGTNPAHPMAANADSGSAVPMAQGSQPGSGPTMPPSAADGFKPNQPAAASGNGSGNPADATGRGPVDQSTDGQEPAAAPGSEVPPADLTLPGGMAGAGVSNAGMSRPVQLMGGRVAPGLNPGPGMLNPGGMPAGNKRPFEQEHPGALPLPDGVPRMKVPRLNPAPAGANVPAAGPAAGAQPQPAQHIDKDLKNAALRYLNKVKSRFENQKDVYNDFLDIMKEFQSRQLDTPGVIKKVSTLFQGEVELILGFNDFLPDGYKITERDIHMHYPIKQPARAKPKSAPRSQPSVKTPPELRYAQSYVSKIRKRFRNDREVYRKFLKLLQNYQEDQKSVKEVHDRVKELFKGHPDLLIEFKQFLPDPPDGDGSAANRSRKAPPAKKQRTMRDEESDLKYKDEIEFFSQFKARMAPQQWEDFIKLLNLFNNHILTAMELMLVLRDLFTKPSRAAKQSRRGEEVMEVPDLHNSLHKFVQVSLVLRVRSPGGQMLCGGYVSVFEGKKAAPKGLHRPVQNGVAGPSYMCRPQTTLPICSSRDDLCTSALNDQYSLNPLGSEQTAVLTNTHEMLLFKAEDERFELEMMVHRTEWAIDKLEPIAEELSTLSRTEKQRYEIYDRLNIVVMRTIQRLYGEAGMQVVDWVYDCPGAAVPVVLARLKQRSGELKAIQHDQHKIWLDVYEKNYHKALDHRSYAFKTHDKKALHTKAIIQGIKEAPLVHTYCTKKSVEDIGLWYVLKEIVKDQAGDDAAAITDFWENWLCAHLFPPKKASAPVSKTRHQQNSGPKDKWVLYGNQALVSVIRLHQLLHSRMAEAKQMASEEVPKRELDVLGQPTTPRVPGEEETQPDPATVCATPKPKVCRSDRALELWLQVADPFQAFLSILLAMLRNHVDINKYEDECRTLLGTYSYKLFTLDKLIPRFIKETNTLIQSEHWQTMKKGAAKVESGTTQPSELKSSMLELFWHNCFECDYTISTSTMRISSVPLKETEDIPALAVAASSLIEATEAADDKASASGMEEDDDDLKSKAGAKDSRMDVDGGKGADGLGTVTEDDQSEMGEDGGDDDDDDNEEDGAPDTGAEGLNSLLGASGNRVSLLSAAGEPQAAEDADESE